LEKHLKGETDDSKHREARRLGGQVNAALVIWGNVYEWGETWEFHPRLTIVSTTNISRKDIGPWVVELKRSKHPAESITEPVQLARFVIGYSYYESGEYENALNHFNKLTTDFQVKEPKEKSFIGDIHLISGNAEWSMSPKSKNISEVKYHLQQAIKHYQEAQKYYDPAVMVKKQLAGLNKL